MDSYGLIGLIMFDYRIDHRWSSNNVGVNSWLPQRSVGFHWPVLGCSHGFATPPSFFASDVEDEDDLCYGSTVGSNCWWNGSRNHAGDSKTPTPTHNFIGWNMLKSQIFEHLWLHNATCAHAAKAIARTLKHCVSQLPSSRVQATKPVAGSTGLWLFPSVPAWSTSADSATVQT